MAYFSGVSCDKCGAKIGYMSVWEKKHLQMWARKEGWTIGKQCLCSKCKKVKKT
jgi:hypothetical protein